MIPEFLKRAHYEPFNSYIEEWITCSVNVKEWIVKPIITLSEGFFLLHGHEPLDLLEGKYRSQIIDFIRAAYVIECDVIRQNPIYDEATEGWPLPDDCLSKFLDSYDKVKRAVLDGQVPHDIEGNEIFVNLRDLAKWGRNNGFNHQARRILAQYIIAGDMTDSNAKNNRSNGYPKNLHPEAHSHKLEELYQEKKWTLSQAAFLIFDRVYTSQDIGAKNKPEDSFYNTALDIIDLAKEITDAKATYLLDTAKVYLRACDYLRAHNGQGILKGTWRENEYDWRLPRQNFIKWATSHTDIDIGEKIRSKLEQLTKKSWSNCREEIEAAALAFLNNPDNASKELFNNDDIIEHLRSELNLKHIEDKTIKNYLGKIDHPKKRKRGRPS